MKIEIAILEDDNNDFEHLCCCLNFWAEHNEHTINISRFTNEDILNEFNQKTYDLLFADIDLNKTCTCNGLLICKKLRANGYNDEIIFLTAFSEYVFQGYDVNAFNFLLKPISSEALSSCLKRFIEIHEKQYYCFQDRSNIMRVRFNDIIYIEKNNHDVVFHTNSIDFNERLSLNNIINKLPSNFFQCHKSYIININHVMSLAGQEVYLSDGSSKTIGRRYLTDIRNALLDLSNH